MSVLVWLPLGIALVMGGSFVVNEWSHGGLSETMGMGHHHMLDYGRQHCTDASGHVVHMTDMPAHHVHADAPRSESPGCVSGSPSMEGM
jgi:hypothetical protein